MSKRSVGFLTWRCSFFFRPSAPALSPGCSHCRQMAHGSWKGSAHQSSPTNPAAPTWVPPAPLVCLTLMPANHMTKNCEEKEVDFTLVFYFQAPPASSGLLSFLSVVSIEKLKWTDTQDSHNTRLTLLQFVWKNMKVNIHIYSIYYFLKASEHVQLLLQLSLLPFSTHPMLQ